MEGREPSSRTTPFRPPNPALPYREDCWSEGETEVLIEAWGDRYVELNRGNLRQKQWQEVADAVNSRPCDARRPPRTDVQCKNRIDTLKKKYKVERAKIAGGGGGSAASSQWKFYPKLEELIGSSVPSHPPQKKPLLIPSQPPLALPLPSHRKGIPLPTASAVRPVEKRPMPVPKMMPVENSFYRRNYFAAPPVEEEEEEDSEESISRSSRSSFRERSEAATFRERAGKRMRREEGEEDGIKELSRAIVKLAEIYERVEVEKQRQMMELEKQRMEFTKGLEFQRMQIFVDSQVQLAKVKRSRRLESERYL